MAGIQFTGGFDWGSGTPANNAMGLGSLVTALAAVLAIWSLQLGKNAASKYCSSCGKEQTEAASHTEEGFCTKCGVAMPPNAPFCGHPT